MEYQRIEIDFPVHKDALMRTASGESHFVWLDSNAHPDLEGGYDWIGGGGCIRECTPEKNVFGNLRESFGTKGFWRFGRLAYDVKNDLENLHSSLPDRMKWPITRFFEPDWVIFRRGDSIFLDLHPQSQWTMESWVSRFLMANEVPLLKHEPVHLISGTSREEYVEAASQLMKHIQRGDIYEVNYCIEYFAESAQIDPVQTHLDLMKKGAPPMSALWHTHDEWILSMSPERYLRKRGSEIVSQPIKGTARKSADPKEDAQIAKALSSDPKERAENVMIVDLVRNDLSRVARRGTVNVKELFGIHSFRTVHQMISTVSAQLKEDADVWDALSVSYPMGSMTGAPKIRAMELIEDIENHCRGMYSGSIGYIDPNGDADFNVIIRSVLWDPSKSTLSVSVGSALTSAAKPEQEWAECGLKLQAIQEVLQH